MAEYNGVELYEKNGEFGVLVSAAFGTGWSTWNDNPALAYDKRVIEFWLNKKDDKKFMREIAFSDYNNEAHKTAEIFFKSIGYSRSLDMGGFSDIKLKFVQKGVPWRIKEYDGFESLETFDDAGFIVF